MVLISNFHLSFQMDKWYISASEKGPWKISLFKRIILQKLLNITQAESLSIFPNYIYAYGEKCQTISLTKGPKRRIFSLLLDCEPRLFKTVRYNRDLQSLSNHVQTHYTFNQTSIIKKMSSLRFPNTVQKVSEILATFNWF